MRRDIWKKCPTELQERLSTPGCREYKRRREELEETPHSWSNKDAAINVEYDRLSDECDQFYENLSEADKATLEDECDIIFLNDDVSSYLWDAARHAELSEYVWSVDTELQYIGEMQATKYIYPEYGRLVGAPLEQDFIDYGKDMGSRGWWITDERKADLLWLGAFEWNGLYIARAYCQSDKDQRGWLVCTDPDYVPEDVLGARSMGPYRYQLAFTPFHGVRSQWLHDYLFDCDVELGNRVAREKNQQVAFRDGNPYNCLPDNLVLAEKRRRGRPMLCQSCGQETTKEDSMVVREGTQKPRYCLACLRWMTDEG